MFAVIGILIIIISILLIGVVLLQPGKGDLSASFGGLSGQFGTMFGMKRTTDFLTKLTIGLAAGILLLTLIVNRFFLSPGEIEGPKPVTEGASVPAQTMPMAPPPGTQPITPPGGGK